MPILLSLLAALVLAEGRAVAATPSASGSRRGAPSGVGSGARTAIAPAARRARPVRNRGKLLTRAPLLVGRGDAPSVAVDAAGNAVVVWQRGHDVLARRILTDGRTLDVTVAPGSGGPQAPYPRVAAADDGRFAVAWTAPHGTSLGVYVALYSPQATLLGAARLASSRSAPVVSFPQLGFAADGASFVVAWTERPAVGPPFAGTEVFARAFDGATAAPLAPDVRLSTAPFDLASVLRVEPLDGGNFAVLWTQVIRRGPSAQHVAVVGADGAVVAPSYLLTAHGSASVVATSTGFSAWVDDLLEPEGWVERRFARDGTPLGIGGREPLEACSGGFVGGARTASDRDALRCLTQGGRAFPSTDRELLFGPVGGPLAAVVVSPCDWTAGSCGVSADLPAPWAVTGPGSATAWQLVWASGGEVFLLAAPPEHGGYVRFDRLGTTVKAGETGFVGIARTTPATGPVTVRWTAVADGGGARPGEDFVAATGTVSWGAGETGIRLAEIETRADRDGRDRESFAVVLEELSDGALYGAPTAHRVTLADDPRCDADGTTLCLAGGRFAAQVRYTAPIPGGGFLTSFGLAEPHSEEAGFFWFDDPRNLELAVKVLDFGAVWKVYYAQLTDFAFDLAVTDLYTDVTQTYRPTPGNCGGLDNDFADLGRLTGGAATGKTLAGDCATDALCLLGGRYEVRVAWSNPYDASRSGTGRPEALTDFAGLFSFEQRGNVELVVKVLDFGDRILLLSGAMTDFEYTLSLRETTTGAVREYRNPPRNYCGIFDPDVF